MLVFPFNVLCRIMLQRIRNFQGLSPLRTELTMINIIISMIATLPISQIPERLSSITAEC